MRKRALFVSVAAALVVGVVIGSTATAQQKPDPRQQNYPMANKKQLAGEVNPATQQIDFYIRSPRQNPKNKPSREVMHFFGMEVTWKEAV
jgi:hypothetical protein